MPIRRRFGQNFLTDQHALGRIAGALELTGVERVVEVGPGRGALTHHLVGRCAHLTCVEIDRDLARSLREKYEGRPDVSIMEGDVLETDLDMLAGGPFMLVGNVPYNITTPIIFHALASAGLRRAVFLLQREVADRLQAPPATREYGALTVNVGLTCAVARITSVPAGAFFPRPTVQSAVVRLQPHAAPFVTAAKADAVRAFVTAMFGQRRRQLARALRTVAGATAPAAVAAVQQAGLDPSQRPEELSAGEFVRLYEASRPG